MARAICNACNKPIRANAAMVLVHTETTTERWHLACCPLGCEPAVIEPKETRND